MQISSDSVVFFVPYSCVVDFLKLTDNSLITEVVDKCDNGVFFRLSGSAVHIALIAHESSAEIMVIPF